MELEKISTHLRNLGEQKRSVNHIVEVLSDGYLVLNYSTHETHYEGRNIAEAREIFLFRFYFASTKLLD